MNGVRVSNAKKWMGREGGKVVEFTRMGWHNGISPDSPEQAEAFLTFCELFAAGKWEETIAAGAQLLASYEKLSASFAGGWEAGDGPRFQCQQMMISVIRKVAQSRTQLADAAKKGAR